MGVAPYEQVPVTDISLEAGDRVLLYTDGVSERFNTGKKPYGEERVCRQMEQPGVDGPAAIISGIMQDLETFSGGRPADDDQALLLAFIE
jgi:sigma-B regulation protein RsbU (phosphoserine phosphatase)